MFERSGTALSLGKYCELSAGTTKAMIRVTTAGIIKQAANIIRLVVQYCEDQNDGVVSYSCFSSSLMNNWFSFSVSMMKGGKGEGKMMNYEETL